MDKKLDYHLAVKDYLILVLNGRSCPTKGEALSQVQRLTSSGLISSCCPLGSKACRTSRAWGKSQLGSGCCRATISVQCCERGIHVVEMAVLTSQLTPVAPEPPCPPPSDCHVKAHRSLDSCLPSDWLKVPPQAHLRLQHQHHPSLKVRSKLVRLH